MLLDTPGVIPKKEYSSSDIESIARHTKVGGRSYSQIKEPELIVANAVDMASAEVGRGNPVATVINGAIITHPINPPTSTYEEICGPIIHPTPRSAGEVVTPP